MLRNKELQNSKIRGNSDFQLFQGIEQMLKWDFISSEVEDKSSMDVTCVLEASTVFRL